MSPSLLYSHCWGQNNYLPSFAPPRSTSTKQHTPELPSVGRFKARVTPPSFAVRGTSKARHFRPRSARLAPSTQDGRRFALSCQRALSQTAWLHPALPPTFRYVPHASPRNSPLVVRCLGPDPTSGPALCLFQVDIYSTLLHLFMYPVTLCVLRHRFDLLTLLVVSRCSDGSPPFLVLRGRIRIQPQ